MSLGTGIVICAVLWLIEKNHLWPVVLKRCGCLARLAVTAYVDRPMTKRMVLASLILTVLSIVGHRFDNDCTARRAWLSQYYDRNAHVTFEADGLLKNDIRITVEDSPDKDDVVFQRWVLFYTLTDKSEIMRGFREEARRHHFKSVSCGTERENF